MLNDITTSKNHLLIYQNGKKADDDIPCWVEALQTGSPLEFEDDWGNRLVPNWELKFDGE